MENVERQIIEVPLHNFELMQLRNALVATIKKIDFALGGRDKRGAVLRDFIINGLCEYYGINHSDLKIKGRSPQKIERKRLCCYLLKKHTRMTYGEIAKELGYKEHTAVIHHVKESENLLSNEVYGDKQYQLSYKRLIKHLNL